MKLLLVLLPLVLATSSAARLPYIIGGGDVAKAGTYPWQGSLQFLGSHSCGCSLISTTYALTAAHCVMGASLQSVILGAHDITQKTEGDPTNYAISSMKKHPGWDATGDGFPNDVALIKLSTAANTASEFIGTIGLAATGTTDDQYTDCVITGWGAIDMILGIIPVMPENLQEGGVGVYSKTKCVEMFSEVGGATINDGHICVGVESKIGACSGDSGGPLVCKVNGVLVQAGLTSWGISTCDPKFPSVYTRVSYFREWIDANMV